MTSAEPAAIETPAEAPRGTGGRSRRVNWLLIIGLAFVGNLTALILFPPFDIGDPSAECVYPICYIEGTLELPTPHVVWPSLDHQLPEGLVIWDVSISSSLFTMWIIMVVVIVLMLVMTRKQDMVPSGAQNAIEALYDGLQSFAVSLGGPRAKTYVPLFVTFFVFILFCNWSGLLPFVGRIIIFRAPTSDVNTTIGLALVSFAIFHIEGVRALGVGGYLSKFFPLGEFRNGIGAGIIALFVGLIELMLEFVKPLTLSMRLFGNIYGGEVALGVILALTVAFVPVAIYGLELMLNLVQALIFSVLTLMFILAAIEGHGHDEAHETAPEGAHSTDGEAHGTAVPAPAH